MTKTLVATALAGLVIGVSAACGTPATISSKPATSSAAPWTPPTDVEQQSADSDGQRILDAIKENYGGTSWGVYIVGAEVRSGMLHVQAQIDRNADQDIAEKIERGVYNLVTTSSDLPKVSWVIVEDGAGVVVTQRQVK